MSFAKRRRRLKRRIGPSPEQVIPVPKIICTHPPEERRYGSVNQCAEWCSRCGVVLDS